MAVCGNCGNQVQDGQLTCPLCGAYIGAGAQVNQQQNMYNQQSMYNQAPQQNMYGQQGTNNQAPQQNLYNQQETNNQAPQQNMYGQQGIYNQTPQQGVQQYAAQPELGMKWFKFVIYFQLFVAAISGFWNGWRLLSGSIYGLDADDLTYVYNYFSGLKGVDTIIGICFIALGIFALVTRFILADFKKAGPAMYIGLLAANIVLSIAYYASVSGIVGGEVDMDYTSTYSSIVASVVLLICNIVYFKKRKHLFNR